MVALARILITDRVDEKLIGELKRRGYEVDYKPGVSYDELLKLVPEYDALVVRSRTKVTREVIERGERLRVIARAGVGLDNIDVEAAREKGIKVINVPEAATQSVAELTIGLMIAAARRIVELNLLLRGGEWRKAMGFELYGKRLLVIGFGRIGRRVAELAKLLGMEVAAYDVVDAGDAARRMGVELEKNLRDAVSRADVVTLHVPLTPQTYHMVNRELLESFKRGSILVNTARGAVVDTEAVLWALEEGILWAYAADVLEHEPPQTDAERKLVAHPRAIITPHIGSQTREAQRRIAEILVEKLDRALRGE